MSKLEDTAIEHLQSLAEAARSHWESDGTEDDLEVELVRAEDFLKSWPKLLYDNELTEKQDISWKRN